MRRLLAVPMLLILLLCACGSTELSARTPVRFRSELLSKDGCSFTTALTADFGTYTRNFTLDCSCTREEAKLTVRLPEEAAGITGTISGKNAEISFMDTVLAVEQCSSVSPLALPGILYQAWTEGYISSMSMDGELEKTEYTLGQGTEQLRVLTWFREGQPIRAEVSQGETTIISCTIENLAYITKEAENYESAEENLGGGQSGSSSP